MGCVKFQFTILSLWKTVICETTHELAWFSRQSGTGRNFAKGIALANLSACPAVTKKRGKTCVGLGCFRTKLGKAGRGASCGPGVRPTLVT